MYTTEQNGSLKEMIDAKDGLDVGYEQTYNMTNYADVYGNMFAVTDKC